MVGYGAGCWHVLQHVAQLVRLMKGCERQRKRLDVPSDTAYYGQKLRSSPELNQRCLSATVVCSRQWPNALERLHPRFVALTVGSVTASVTAHIQHGWQPTGSWRAAKWMNMTLMATSSAAGQ